MDSELDNVKRNVKDMEGQFKFMDDEDFVSIPENFFAPIISSIGSNESVSMAVPIITPEIKKKIKRHKEVFKPKTDTVRYHINEYIKLLDGYPKYKLNTDKIREFLGNIHNVDIHDIRNIRRITWDFGMRNGFVTMTVVHHAIKSTFTNNIQMNLYNMNSSSNCEIITRVCDVPDCDAIFRTVRDNNTKCTNEIYCVDHEIKMYKKAFHRYDEMDNKKLVPILRDLWDITHKSDDFDIYSFFKKHNVDKYYRQAIKEKCLVHIIGITGWKWNNKKTKPTKSNVILAYNISQMAKGLRISDTKY